jgi:inhibitor of cysteine peptidase
VIWLSVSRGQIAAAEENPDTVYGEDKLHIAITAQQPTFTLKLKSNPTTGYAWFLREYDPLIVTPIKQQFIAGDKNKIGAPGLEYWTFKIKPTAFTVPQQTVIRLIYARPWQSNDSGTQLVFRVSTLHAD